MADKTIAVGSNINYRIEHAVANCLYKVFLIDRDTNAVRDIRHATADTNGVAVATFPQPAVGQYIVQAEQVNCGRCPLRCYSVDVVLAPSVNQVGCCNPCDTGTTTCAANWNISPKTFYTGVDTNVSYTVSGIPRCRLKILFFDGELPFVDEGTGQQAFTYISNGQPLNAVLNWPGAVAGRNYNWRPAPMAEQDPCLQNCIITPQRIDLTISASSTPCAINWDVQPRALTEGQFATLTLTGGPPGCDVRFAHFTEAGDPLIVGGVHLITTALTDASGNAAVFVGPCTTSGVQVLKPAVGGQQSSCASYCTFNNTAVTVTCTEVGDLLDVTYVSRCLPNVSTPSQPYWSVLFSGLNSAHTYKLQGSTDGGVTFPELSDPITGVATYDFQQNSVTSSRNAIRIKDMTTGDVSATIYKINCAAPSADKYYCVSGNCVQAGTQPPSSTGPYDTLTACQAVCSISPSTYTIAMVGGPGACGPIGSGVVAWRQGEFKSVTFAVTGGASTAVVIYGIPGWMTRTNNPGSITLSGTPPTTSSHNITLSAPGCTVLWELEVSAACAISWSLAHTTMTHGVDYTQVYSATGPAGQYLVLGVFLNDTPVTVGGTQITGTVPLGGSISAPNNWPAAATGYNWRPMPMSVQAPGIQSCTIYPSRIDLTIT